MSLETLIYIKNLLEEDNKKLLKAKRQAYDNMKDAEGNETPTARYLAETYQSMCDKYEASNRALEDFWDQSWKN